MNIPAPPEPSQPPAGPGSAPRPALFGVFAALTMVLVLAAAALAADTSFKVFEMQGSSPWDAGDWGRQLHSVLFDEGSTLRKLHQICVYGLLAAVAVALGVFLFRLLAYLGIVDDDLPKKMKDIVAPDAKHAPAASGVKSAGLLRAALPLAVTCAAAGATVGIALNVAPPPDIHVKLDGPESVKLKYEVQPQSPLTQTVTFAVDKSSLPITFRPLVTSSAPPSTVTVALDAKALDGAARELNAAAGKFTDASVALKASTDAEIGKLAAASGSLFRATFVMNSDLHNLARNGVTTAYAPPRPCSDDYFKLMVNAPPEDVAVLKGVCGNPFIWKGTPPK
jgi:hypothetical protein